ncbi:hypothetical protein D3C72_2198670 [compost metagenome]
MRGVRGESEPPMQQVDGQDEHSVAGGADDPAFNHGQQCHHQAAQNDKAARSPATNQEKGHKAASRPFGGAHLGRLAHQAFQGNAHLRFHSA